MASKKRKLNFDLDELEEKQGVILDICKSLDNCCIHEAAADVLTPQKILGLAVIKFGLSFVENILSIISVIPEESGPWRQEIAYSLLNMLNGTNRINAEQEHILKVILESSEYKHIP